MFLVYFLFIIIKKGYYGMAVGKAAQSAKTEIEKTKVTIYQCLNANFNNFF
jgi:hypothetical protein